MNAKQAVAVRIQELCKERGITVNTLANMAGTSPSTIYSMLNEKSNNPGIVTIHQVCDGLEISLREFFDSPIFDELEQEIQSPRTIADARRSYSVSRENRLRHHRPARRIHPRRGRGRSAARRPPKIGCWTTQPQCRDCHWH